MPTYSSRQGENVIIPSPKDSHALDRMKATESAIPFALRHPEMRFLLHTASYSVLVHHPPLAYAASSTTHPFNTDRFQPDMVTCSPRDLSHGKPHLTALVPQCPSSLSSTRGAYAAIGNDIAPVGSKGIEPNRLM